MALKRGTAVEVTWLDAEAQSGWGAIREVRDKPVPVKSLGFVLHDNDEAIVLAGDVGEKLTEDEDVNRTMIIPRGMVQKVRRLS